MDFVTEIFIKRGYFPFALFCIVAFSFGQALAQADTAKIPGVKVVVPIKEKKNNTYYFICIGYQNPSWYKVPMIPENHENLEVKGNTTVKTQGFFAGIGIMKKTRSHFEVGLLGDFYKSAIPVAYSGQRSEGDWVLEQSGFYYTQNVFVNDIDRISEVFSIRASIRYKIPIGNLQFWGGLSPGTFSSKIYFSEKSNNTPLGTYRSTSIGLTYQAGTNFLIKNKLGKDLMRFSLFSDFSGPVLEEKIIGLFNHPAWKFLNTEGNTVINPVRFGFSVGFH